MSCYKQSDVINLKKKGKGKKEGNKERRRKEEREYIDTYKIMLIPKNHHFSKKYYSVVPFILSFRNFPTQRNRKFLKFKCPFGIWK